MKFLHTILFSTALFTGCQAPRDNEQSSSATTSSGSEQTISQQDMDRAAKYAFIAMRDLFKMDDELQIICQFKYKSAVRVNSFLDLTIHHDAPDHRSLDEFSDGLAPLDDVAGDFSYLWDPVENYAVTFDEAQQRIIVSGDDQTVIFKLKQKLREDIDSSNAENVPVYSSEVLYVKKKLDGKYQHMFGDYERRHSYSFPGECALVREATLFQDNTVKYKVDFKIE